MPSARERAVHFLRGVGARATFALPAFYLFLAAREGHRRACLIEGYPGVILRRSIELSSIGTVSMACRNVFDHDPRKMTGKAFADSSDATLEAVAEYWAESSKRPTLDALAALQFLRTIFRDCSKTNTALFDDGTSLGRRVGLLKQHADRAAAHLSLEDFEFSTQDCAHVVAALAMLGAIIVGFDNSDRAPSYFDDPDEAAMKAAVQLFPGMPNIRLFQAFNVELQATLCWQDGQQGRLTLFAELPHAIGWYWLATGGRQ